MAGPAPDGHPQYLTRSYLSELKNNLGLIILLPIISFPMMLRFLPVISLLLAATAAHAQNDGSAAQANLNTLVSGAPTMVPRGSSDGLKGSPYADARWLPAQITLSNKLPLSPVQLKYDVLDHRLLMHKPAPSPDSLQLDDRLVERFVLLDPTASGTAHSRTFRRFREAPSPQYRADYVEVLHEGSYALLKHHLKTMKKASLQGAYNTDQRYDEIEDKSVYYLRLPDASITSVKLTLKTLQTAAPALANGLKTAAAALKPKTEADWVAVFNAADPAPAK